jgi:thiamine-monophosphate kinase
MLSHMPLSEFSLIDQYFRRSQLRDDVQCGIGDDAAILRVPPHTDLVAAIDTLVAGVHFPAGTAPADIGYKAMMVNLSDLAAMGAEPAWATLALTLPESEPDWLTAFSEGFFAGASSCNVALVGGDTTRGPLTITVQVQGFVPEGRAIRRSGAQAGDRLFVTGSLGDAGLGLMYATGQRRDQDDAVQQVLRRLNRPEARISAGLAMRGLASAAIDISDGLLGDLQHILDASDCGATVWMDDLPRSSAFSALVRPDEASWYDLPLSAGDDFELLISVPEAREADFVATMQQTGVAVTAIGHIEAHPGLRCIARDGVRYRPLVSGYQHFS